MRQKVEISLIPYYMSAPGRVQAHTALTVQGTQGKPGTPASTPVPVTPAPTPVPASPSTLPAHPPMGEYAVYQWNGPGGFAYSYRFTLQAGGRYRVSGTEWGTYSYVPSTRQLTFLTGPLRGFGGLYYTQGRNANGPTIALNPRGAVTRLEQSANGTYQFGYFRPEGMR